VAVRCKNLSSGTCRPCVVVEGTDRSADITTNFICFQKISVRNTCSRFVC